MHYLAYEKAYQRLTSTFICIMKNFLRTLMNALTTAYTAPHTVKQDDISLNVFCHILYWNKHCRFQVIYILYVELHNMMQHCFFISFL